MPDSNPPSVPNPDRSDDQAPRPATWREVEGVLAKEESPLTRFVKKHFGGNTRDSSPSPLAPFTSWAAINSSLAIGTAQIEKWIKDYRDRTGGYPKAGPAAE